MKHHRILKQDKRLLSKKKSVRIDGRTVILADANLSDAEVRENYALKRMSYLAFRPGASNQPVKQEFKEVPVGDVMDLEAILDKDNLPDEN
jgi:hypothetical protein